MLLIEQFDGALGKGRLAGSGRARNGDKDTSVVSIGEPLQGDVGDPAGVVFYAAHERLH
jgi:hypothetical protein